MSLFRKNAKKDKTEENNEYLDVMRQITILMERLFDNLFPGANYQRLITSLELLGVLHRAFFVYQPQGMNKASTVGDPGFLVQHVQDVHGLMHFNSHKHMAKMITSCVLHYMIDVKSSAAEILTHFSMEHSGIALVFQNAVELSCSFKFSDCESAAALFKLCLNWHGHSSPWMPFLTADWLAKIKHNKQLITAVNQATNQKKDYSLHCLLLALYHELFEQRQPFLALAKNAPMHGLLTSLRAILEESGLSNNENLSAFHTDLINELERSIQFMMEILSGGNRNKNASFAQMGIAVESMISEEAMEEDLTDDKVAISDDHSLVLACAWLNLKECCLVASKMYRDARPEIIERAGQLIISVLTGTRQKGALEAAASAMAEFCACLLLGQHEKLPEKWLLDLIEQIQNVGQMASVTRRSAGWPMLIRAIVSSENRGTSGGRHLLNLAVNGCIGILNSSDSFLEATETEDVPHSHALHVLK